MPATISHGKISRFAVVGILATLIFAACASLLSGGAGTALLPPAIASVSAYLIAGMFSYAGHKYFTFASGGAHRFEAPRFITLTGVGIGISALVPAIMVNGFSLPWFAPIIATCILVPMVNYLVLDRWVFSARRKLPEADVAL